MDKIQFLFYFSSDDIHLLETKRTDLSANAQMSEIYKWLIYFEASGEFVTLLFKSMLKDGGVEFRTFTEAFLEFDSEKAELSYEGKLFQLVRESTDKISPDLKSKTTKYLLGAI